MDVLTISDAQVGVLRTDARERFVTAVRAVVLKSLPVQPSRACIVALVERAERAGLSSERDVAGFVTVATALDGGAPELAETWPERQLEDPFAPVADRVERLVDAAVALLAAR